MDDDMLLMAMAALAAITATSATAGPAPLAGALGANFNEHYEDVDFGELRQANDRWIRGFLAMPQIDPAHPGKHPAIVTTLEAERRGFDTILTLKFPMKQTGVPKAGSRAFIRASSELDAVLPLVMGKVDILEIGNEPFIEAPKDQWNSDLNDFYEAMARRVIAYRAQHCPSPCRTRLFMGALNRLWDPTWRTAATERWLAFVRNTPEIDGVDIHPHVRSQNETKAFLDYILPRLRPDQKFIASEFSLVWYWREHLRDRVPASFAKTYGIAATTQVWQEIARALAKPFPQQEWDDLLTASPWFARQRTYLTDQMEMFRQTGRLAVAAYGFSLGSSLSRRPFRPDSVPWLLDSVYSPWTVRPHTDGTPGTNPYWPQQFLALTKR